jgi:hypothetical protein
VVVQRYETEIRERDARATERTAALEQRLQSVQADLRQTGDARLRAEAQLRETTVRTAPIVDSSRRC